MGIYSGNLHRVLEVTPCSTRQLEPVRRENVLDIVLTSQKKFVDTVKKCEPLECTEHNQIHLIIKVRGGRNRNK